MSKGSDRVTIRVPQKLLERVEAEIQKREDNATVDPWTMSDFFREAAEELLRKKQAGRKKRKKETSKINT